MAEWIVSADSRKIMKQLVLDAHLSPKDLSGIDDILEKNRVNFQDLKNLKKKLPNNVPICVFLEKLKLHFEPQEYTASLEAKTESLRQKQSQYEYKKIVQSVDPTQKYGKINHMENFGAEMKTVNRQVMSVVNVLITVVGAFFFGFSGVTYAYPHLKLDLATREKYGAGFPKADGRDGAFSLHAAPNFIYPGGMKGLVDLGGTRTYDLADAILANPYGRHRYQRYYQPYQQYYGYRTPNYQAYPYYPTYSNGYQNPSGINFDQYGNSFIGLKSVIQFQQGKLGTSPWRVAVTMTVVTVPAFFSWCLCVRGPSALFYQIGASTSVVLTALSSASILHYIPSPSISTFFQLRFLSENLESCVSLVQTLVLGSSSALLLYYSASFLSAVTSFSNYLLLPLIAYFSLFAIIFSGHSVIMNASLLLELLVMFSGVTVFLYNAIDDVASFTAIVPLAFRWTDSLISFFVGFIVNFYFLNSPFLYQAYSPMPTIHKLRLSIMLYGVFQLFLTLFAFLIATLFSNFLNRHCALSLSFGTFFQFTKVSVAAKFQAYAICAACLCVLNFCFRWCLLSVITVVWEQHLAKRLRSWNPLQQLCFLQLLLVVLLTLLLLAAVGAHITHLPIGFIFPQVVFVIFSAFAMVGGLVTCGYFLPFCSSKGALASFFLTSILLIINLCVSFANNSMRSLQNACDTDSSTGILSNVTHSTVSGLQHNIRYLLSSSRRNWMDYAQKDEAKDPRQRRLAINAEKVFSVVAHMPLQAQPIITYSAFIALCVFVSMMTGGQDQMSLDWNLIAFTWTASVRSPTSFSKRPFLETDSFRFAQRTQSSSSTNIHGYK
ncbi:unnamed protein product [Caenorhabditis auriculariae]|uniref:Uncharacterized protein n=1 Tax=Caenorhabditis auriculariae TaxID=2777116 RepID=A0A8S1HQW9_9PELO|nr:unnamed protein product [Caenorhabditis auriculariae]